MFTDIPMPIRWRWTREPFPEGGVYAMRAQHALLCAAGPGRLPFTETAGSC